MPTLPLPIDTGNHRSRPASSARLLNCMSEALPDGAKSPVLLTRTPGVVSWGTVGNGPIQGMMQTGGVLYVVSGGVLYSVTTAAVATSRGTVGSSSGIDMDANDTAVVVVNPDAATAFTWNGSAFAQITDADFRGASFVEFVDNYLLFVDPDTAVFFGADLGSISSFDALNFATAEGHPDDLTGMRVDHRQVILFGEETTEIWENTGVSGFPFERAINGLVELGCLNGRTVAKLDNSLFWLANDYTIRVLEDVTPVRVSNHVIEQWLRSVTVSSGRAWSYTYEGHLIYVLTFTEGTRCFDVTTQTWHERLSYGNSKTNWEWGWPTSYAGKMLVGSTSSNVIGYLSPTAYDENGVTMPMEWTYQPVFVEGARAYFDKFELEMETGVGLSSGQGVSPEIMLDFSDDGGFTWQSAPNRSLGALGAYGTRVVWQSLGSCSSGHGRIFRPRVSDPVRVNVTNTLVTVRGGRL